MHFILKISHTVEFWSRKNITYCKIMVQVNLIKVSFIKLVYAMVKINYILLERLYFSYNFMYLCSVFLCDFYHLKHIFWASGHMNFPKFSRPSRRTMVAVRVILTEQSPFYKLQNVGMSETRTKHR